MQRSALGGALLGCELQHGYIDTHTHTHALTYTRRQGSCLSDSADYTSVRRCDCFSAAPRHTCAPRGMTWSHGILALLQSPAYPEGSKYGPLSVRSQDWLPDTHVSVTVSPVWKGRPPDGPAGPMALRDPTPPLALASWRSLCSVFSLPARLTMSSCFRQLDQPLRTPATPAYCQIRTWWVWLAQLLRCPCKYMFKKAPGSNKGSEPRAWLLNRASAGHGPA